MILVKQIKVDFALSRSTVVDLLQFVVYNQFRDIERETKTGSVDLLLVTLKLDLDENKVCVEMLKTVGGNLFLVFVMENHKKKISSMSFSSLFYLRVSVLHVVLI